MNDVASLCELVAATGTFEVQIISRVSVAPGRISRATAELCQARHTMSIKIKELSKISQLKMSLRGWKTTCCST